ncbi:uncharacterized protein LOC126787783 [Argentina anserina]|uniref:uncharacterized protein LOC126787783 n=1 Tax=Argentina anserina TaxID=57926 RepID=UPI0021764F58|nr:uncharacterized protein LOC126787783 [Potentilla anserina]
MVKSELEKSRGGRGLHVRGTERVVFRPPAKKLGFDGGVESFKSSYGCEIRDYRDGGGGRSRVRRRGEEEGYSGGGGYGGKRSGCGGLKTEPHSVVSEWDCSSYSPVKIRASGEVVRSLDSRGGRSEISESMVLEMEYECDHAWYDRE